MASYHSSFTYNGINSAKDKNLMITSFEPGSGLTDTFLSMDSVYEDYYDGTKRFVYGSKYNTTTMVSITVMKCNREDFSMSDVRSCLKWLTGSRVSSWLDMYAGEEITYSFLGFVSNVQQYKLDSRTIGLTIEFTSVSPWAYSAPQEFSCSTSQALSVIDNILLKADEADLLGYDNGVLGPSADSGHYFNVTEYGVAYLDNAYRTEIDNQSDDLYTYIYLDIDYTNESGDGLFITNETLGEETILRGMVANENVRISAKQFVTSNMPNKIFGDNFNFVWPRLQPGANHLIIRTVGKGTARFTYRYPMKIGDCAVDATEFATGAHCCGDYT